MNSCSSIDFPSGPTYNRGGNLQLDALLGATVLDHPAGTDMDAALAARADELEAAGRRPYAIPLGGSSVVGAFGYRTAAVEVLRQADAVGFTPAEIVHATSSGGTQAGLIAGLAIKRSAVPVLGVSAGGSDEYLAPIVRSLAEGVIEQLGLDRTFGPAAVVIDDTHVGDAYGVPTDAMHEAVEMCATLEGCSSTRCTPARAWPVSSIMSGPADGRATIRSSSFTPEDRRRCSPTPNSVR